MFGLILFVIFAALLALAVTLSLTSKDPGGPLIVAAVALVLTSGMGYLIFSTRIENQHVGYVTVFNVIQPGRTIAPGIHLKAPWEKVQEVDTSFGTESFGGGKDAEPILQGLTRDQVFLQVDLTVAWAVVPEQVPAFKERFGLGADYTSRVRDIIRSAVRDTIAQTSWKDGGITQRDAFSLAIQRSIEAKAADNFRQAGMGSRSGDFIRWGAVNLRKIVPPQKIQESNNDLAAADIQNALQDKLLLVEKSRKAVREAQAANYNSLVRVPAGMDPRAYAEVLRATTEQMNAETVANSLENGKPITVVVGMGVSPQPTAAVR